MYRCAKCAGSDVSVVDARPSIDERYAIGHCKSCTPLPDPPKDGKPARSWATVQLVRADAWNEDAYQARLEAERRRKLLDQLHAGRLRENTPAYTEAVAIRAAITAGVR